VKPINLVSLTIAAGSGLITLLLMLVRFEPESDFAFALPTLLDWVTTLSAAALIVGILNLLAVHFRKVSVFNLTSMYSITFFVAFFGVVVMWVVAATARFFLAEADPLRTDMVGLGQGTVDFAFKYVQTPIEASLTGILAVVLTLAGARLIRTRRHWSAFIFVAVALFLIISLAPISLLSFLPDLRDVLVQPFAEGAARGILLGVALGVIATGLRVIIGVDQPYGE
jgi:hypothetical protein